MYDPAPQLIGKRFFVGMFAGALRTEYEKTGRRVNLDNVLGIQANTVNVADGSSSAAVPLVWELEELVPLEATDPTAVFYGGVIANSVQYAATARGVTLPLERIKGTVTVAPLADPDVQKIVVPLAGSGGVHGGWADWSFAGAGRGMEFSIGGSFHLDVNWDPPTQGVDQVSGKALINTASGFVAGATPTYTPPTDPDLGPGASYRQVYDPVIDYAPGTTLEPGAGLGTGDQVKTLPDGGTGFPALPGVQPECLDCGSKATGAGGATGSGGTVPVTAGPQPGTSPGNLPGGVATPIAGAPAPTAAPAKPCRLKCLLILAAIAAAGYYLGKKG